MNLKLLFIYSVRNLRERKVTTVLTAVGMALVVFVYTAVLMLGAGLQKTMAATGEDMNVIFIRRSAEVEIQSLVDRQQASIIESAQEVATGSNGEPLISKELVVQISLPKQGKDQVRNLVIHGVGPAALNLHPQVQLTKGRMLRPGSNEIVIGSALAARLGSFEVGSTVRFAQRDWHIVGHFHAGGSGFDSEIWGDTEQLMQTFRRDEFSSVLVRLKNQADFNVLKDRLEADPRLTIEAKRERVFYEEQSRVLSSFIRTLGFALSAIFSVAAVIGATITMYASVASRTKEIGALRALGFRRSSILFIFLTEAMLLGLVGWTLGMLFATSMTFVQISSLNWTSFSEFAFRFVITPEIALKSLLFAIVMGFLGGFLPSVRAAWLKIVDALRTA